MANFEIVNKFEDIRFVEETLRQQRLNLLNEIAEISDKYSPDMITNTSLPVVKEVLRKSRAVNQIEQALSKLESLAA